MFCGKYNDIIQKPTTERRSLPVEFEEWVAKNTEERGYRRKGEMNYCTINRFGRETYV